MTTTNAPNFTPQTHDGRGDAAVVSTTRPRTVLHLKMAAMSAISFGLLSALGSHSATDAPARYFLDVLLLPIGEVAPTLTDQNQVALAILGGVMLSWGVLMYLLTDALAHTQPKLLKRLIFITLASWFVVDSIGSVASGAWFNVILNVGFGALFIVPARHL